MIAAYLTALVGVIAAQAAPGPNMMAVIGMGLARGRRQALLVVAGIVSGVVIWAAAFAYGLGELLDAFPAALTGLKFAGGLYLLFVAARALLAARRGPARSDAGRGAFPVGAMGAWRRGLLVVMTNPKAALMWWAVATFLFGAGLSQGAVLAFGPVAALSAALIYGSYGLVSSSARASILYARFARLIEATFGLVFGALGLALVASGIKALRP